MDLSKMHGLLFAIIVIACQSNSAEVQSNGEVRSATIAKLNYWHLSGKLVSDRNLQDMLKVEQIQVEKIREFREKLGKENLLEEQLGLLLEKNLPDNSVYEPDHIWLSLDNVVVADLEKILDRNQLLELRQFELRRLYRRSFEYFRDPQITKFIELNAKENESLSQKVIATESRYALSLKEIELEHDYRVIRELSPDSIQKFAEYAGNFFDPAITIGDRIDLDRLPYSLECKTEELLKVLNEPRFLERSKISVKQKALVEKEVKSIYGSHLMVKDPAEMQRLLKLNQRVCAENIKSLLNREQYLVLMRAAAASEFARTTEMQLRRIDVLKYLEIEKSEETNLRRIAAQSCMEMNLKIDALNKSIFDELANSLSSEPRKRLLALFLGKW